MQWVLIGKEAPGLVTGGLNRYIEGYLPAMIAAGERVEAHFYGTVRAGQFRSAPFRILRAFLGGLRIGRVDVIDSHFAMYGTPFVFGALVGARISRRARPRIVIHFHGPWSDESVQAGVSSRSVGIFAKRALERWALRRASRVIVLTEVFRNEAVRMGAVPSKVTVLGPGVDEVWASVERNSPAERNSISLLCVRRLTARMGHEALIRTLHELNFGIDQRDIALHIVGVGELENHLRTLVAELGRERQVTFYGRLSDDELRSLAASCDAAVVPTLALEGFGLVVIEAMAMGLPVISTGQGGLSEAMGPWSRPPFVFSLSDSSSLRDAIKAVESPSSHSLSLAVRNYALTYRWESVVERTIQEVSA